MDEVFVVTGGGSGIGRAVAEALPKKATVVITGRTMAKLQHTADALNAQGHHAIPLTCDVSNRAEVRSLAQHASELGKVDKVIHAAGISGSMADAEKIVRINALGTVYVNQEFYKVMDGGVIVDVASNSGYMLPSAMIPRRAYPLALTNEACPPRLHHAQQGRRPTDGLHDLKELRALVCRRVRLQVHAPTRHPRALCEPRLRRDPYDREGEG